MKHDDVTITTIGGETIEIKYGTTIHCGMVRIKSRTDEGQMTLRMPGQVWADNEEAWYDANPVFAANAIMITPRGLYYAERPSTARELLAMDRKIIDDDAISRMRKPE